MLIGKLPTAVHSPFCSCFWEPLLRFQFVSVLKRVNLTNSEIKWCYKIVHVFDLNLSSSRRCSGSRIRRRTLFYQSWKRQEKERSRPYLEKRYYSWNSIFISLTTYKKAFQQNARGWGSYCESQSLLLVGGGLSLSLTYIKMRKTYSALQAIS